MRAALHYDPGRHLRGDQFKPEFLEISPNNRMPAIVDHGGPGGKPISVFESGAILQYLGRKTGRFYPRDERGRVEVEQWLFWQMANLGPKAGEANHFRNYAPEQLPYAIDRFSNEMHRLYGVMNTRLDDREFSPAGYSIADIACVGWASHAERFGHDLGDFPNVRRWREAVQHASGRQARTVGQGGSSLSGRLEGSEGARGAVQSKMNCSPHEAQAECGSVSGRPARRSRITLALHPGYSAPSSVLRLGYRTLAHQGYRVLSRHRKARFCRYFCARARRVTRGQRLCIEIPFIASLKTPFKF